MYVFGHVALLLSILQLAVPVIGGRAPALITAAALAVAAGYYLWAWLRMFPRRPLFAALAGTLALVTGGAVWAGAMVLLVQLLRK
jgi:hypothetical protein